ncbi:MAG: hypothetical protein ACR2QF_11025 [Geminicoccaceae bacterium]
MIMPMPASSWRRIEITSILGLLALAFGLNVYLWRIYNKPPVAPVELLSASLAKNQLPIGGTLLVHFDFIKARDDCDNGRASRYVWNADGAWIQVAAEKPVRQAPESESEQTIEVKVPLISARSGEPVPPGQWSMHTIVVYDCPYQGGFIVMDKTINTPPFEILDR